MREAHLEISARCAVHTPFRQTNEAISVASTQALLKAD
jgi:hypothetical protein